MFVLRKLNFVRMILNLSCPSRPRLRSLQFEQKMTHLINTMKHAAICLLLSGMTVWAQTNQTPLCCQYPVRSFGNGKMVNLAPLFRWWMDHINDHPGSAGGNADSDRPLSAWKRVTGVKMETLAYGWVVKARITDEPGAQTNEQIVLENPPAAEEQRYYALKARLLQYNEQISNDTRAYQADTRAENSAANRASSDARSRNWRNRIAVGNYNRQAARKRKAAEIALNEQKKYEQARDLAQKQLNLISSNGKQYQIDCFALEIGRSRQGLPVFNTGMMNGP